MEREQARSFKLELSQLARSAYEREMDTALQELDSWFDQWKIQNISAIELSEKIHRFHQDDARELWSKYVSNTLHDLLVAAAIQKGIIRSNELSEELLEFLKPKIKLYRNLEGEE